MSEPSMGDILKRCGMVQSVPGKFTGVVNWAGPERIPTDGIHVEFPDIYIKSQGTRTSPGQPMIWEGEIAGPPDQVRAFVSKYGNDNLKAEMGLL